MGLKSDDKKQFIIMFISQVKHKVQIIKENQSTMSISQQQSNASQIRQKRIAIRKKLQQQINSSNLKKLMFHSDKLSLKSHSDEPLTSETLKMYSIAQGHHGKKYNSEKLNKFQEKYQVCQILGEGANSTVYRCRQKNTKRDFAAKKFRFRDQESIIDTKKLFYGLKKLLYNCQKIRQNYKFIMDNKTKIGYAILQYCDFQNLTEVLYSRPEKRLPETQVVRIIYSILEVLDFMHSKGVSHRDLKSQNVLYDPQTGKIKVIDLDTCKIKPQEENNFEMWTKTGTLFYRAPQTFTNATYTQKIDIWGLGIIAYELITGKLPFQNHYEKQTIKLIVSGEIDFEYLNISDNLKYLLKGLLQKKPNDRPNAKESRIFIQKCFGLTLGRF